MTHHDDPLSLAAEFPPATRDQWLKLVESALKGAPFEKRLVSRTEDGLTIEPLYPRAAAARPVAGRVPGTAWRVMQRVDHPDPGEANAQALTDLENGATGLSLVFAGSVGAHGFGLPASDDAITRALEGVQLDAGIALDLDLAAESAGAPAAIAELVTKSGVDPAALDWRMNFDPIGAFAATGYSLVDWPVLAPRFAAMIGEFAEGGFRGPFALADGRVVHNASGSPAQELAWVLGVAVAYLRTFEGAGAAPDRARKWLTFKLSADADQFLTVAKFRALRKLWARVEDACGLAPRPALVAAETAWRMMTQRDPWVNLLRTTVATFSAGLGGADAVTVLPFTLALGLPDGFARRLARNTQLLLLEESNLAKVADPTAGSGGIEELTDKLSGAAWTLFQDIERAGGAWAALQGGLIQREVSRVRTERGKALARRKHALTGTSEFPDIHEAKVAVLVPRSAGDDQHFSPPPASGGEGGPNEQREVRTGWGGSQAPPTPDPSPPLAEARGGRGEFFDHLCEPLPSLRLAEPFEALRDASDRLLAEQGVRPKVFLANLGSLAEFTARATFAKNLFEAGGIEAVTNEGFARSPHSDRHPSRDASRPPQDDGAAAHPSPPEDDGLAGHSRHPEERAERASKGDARLPGHRSPAAGDLASSPSPLVGEGRGGGWHDTKTRTPTPDPSPQGGGEQSAPHAHTDFPALVATFEASGARLACLCSSDEVYAREALAAAAALKDAGADPIYLAGRPGEAEAALRESGVQGFVYAGCDVLATLQAAHDILSVMPRDGGASSKPGDC